jgi:Tfp pilus assembly protein PilO
MKKLTKREKVIVIVVGLVAVVFLVNQFIIEPQTKKLRKVQKELDDLNKQYASITVKLAELTTLSSEVAKKERKLAELEQVLTQKVELAEIIHQVSTEAQIHGLQLQNLRPGQTRPMITRSGRSGEFRRADINIGIRGLYQQLGNFVSALEKQPFYLKIAELRVQRGRPEEKLLDIQLKLEVILRS